MEPTVEYACALLLRNSKVLLGFRAPHKRNFPNCWDMIGGHIEAGEAAAAALVRELQEELAVTPSDFDLWQVIDQFEGDGGPLARWHLFIVRAWAPATPVIANDEHTEIRWFDLTDAEALTPLASETYRPLFRALQARLGPTTTA